MIEFPEFGPKCSADDKPVLLLIMGSDNGSVPDKHQAIILINDALFQWCIYASLKLNDLKEGYARYLAIVLG